MASKKRPVKKAASRRPKRFDETKLPADPVWMVKELSKLLDHQQKQIEKLERDLNAVIRALCDTSKMNLALEYVQRQKG